MEEPRTRGRLIWTRSRLSSWSSAGTEPTARWIRLVKLIKDYHPYHWHLTPKTSLQVAQKKRLHLNASLSQYLLKELQGVYPTSILTGVLLKSKEREILFLPPRETTDEPLWLPESDGGGVTGGGERKGKYTGWRGETNLQCFLPEIVITKD